MSVSVSECVCKCVFKCVSAVSVSPGSFYGHMMIQVKIQVIFYTLL